MIKYLKIDNINKGTITHEDKETDGLDFKCYFNEDDNKYYIIVEGEEGKINAWGTRNNSEDTDEETVNTLIETLNSIEPLNI